MSLKCANPAGGDGGARQDYRHNRPALNSQSFPTVQPDAARNAAVESAWADYCAARQRVDRTLALADAVATGKCWKRFLDMFVDGGGR
jgi:hypothetical protein